MLLSRNSQSYTHMHAHIHYRKHLQQQLQILFQKYRESHRVSNNSLLEPSVPSSFIHYTTRQKSLVRAPKKSPPFLGSQQKRTNPSPVSPLNPIAKFNLRNPDHVFSPLDFAPSPPLPPSADDGLPFTGSHTLLPAWTFRCRRLSFVSFSALSYSPSLSFCRSFSTSARPPPPMPAMDKMPKFRRKPKNPTIETAIDRTSSDTADSATSAEHPHPKQQQTTTTLVNPSPKPCKKSPFRNFRLRNSAKRARESPPTEFPSKPPPAIVTLEGVKSETSPPDTADAESKRNGGERPRIPAFLALSSQGTFFSKPASKQETANSIGRAQSTSSLLRASKLIRPQKSKSSFKS